MLMPDFHMVVNVLCTCCEGCNLGVAQVKFYMEITPQQDYNKSATMMYVTVVDLL